MSTYVEEHDEPLDWADGDEEWTDPVSMEEAVRRRAEALANAQQIEEQLGSYGRDETGAYRMPYDEYLVWRRKAKVALRYRRDEQRRLTAWIKARRGGDGSKQGTGLEELPTKEVVDMAYAALRELQHRLPPEE